jgi:ribonuclease HI
MCRRLVGKQWGLKPKLTLWIYTAIIRPIISYGSIAWWEKVSQKTAQDKLNKLQRLACLATLGASKSSPTNALELLLDLPPLHLFVKNTALNTYCRHKISKIKVVKHLDNPKLLQELDKNKELKQTVQNNDYLNKEYNFEFPFSVEFPSKEDWINIICEDTEDKEMWYTDGSKTSHGTGSGVYGSKENHRLSIKLEDHNTVFQAEVFAIQKCAKYIQSREIKEKQIVIHSDSKSALMAINSNIITSTLVSQTVKELQKLSLTNEVVLKWIPAHTGYMGNEIADQCAKAGSEKPTKRLRNGTTVPSTSIGTPKSNIRSLLKKELYNKSENNWQSSTNLQHARKFLPGYNTKRSKELLNLNRKKTSLITNFLTGHAPTRYILKKKGLYNDDVSCRFCEEDDETAEHLLCDCSKFNLEREIHLGLTNAVIHPEDFHTIPFKNIYVYLKSLKFR